MTGAFARGTAISAIAVSLGSCSDRPTDRQPPAREVVEAVTAAPPSAALAPTPGVVPPPMRGPIPAPDLAKLTTEGRISGRTLTVRVHNDTDWFLKEFLVEVRPKNGKTLKYRLLPVSDSEEPDDFERKYGVTIQVTQLPPFRNGAFGAQLFTDPGGPVSFVVLEAIGCKDPTNCSSAISPPAPGNEQSLHPQ